MLVLGGIYRDQLGPFLAVLRAPAVCTLHTVLPAPAPSLMVAIQGIAARSAAVVVMTREAARLLKLTNIEVLARHVLIEGTLGKYAVHLGSASVHRLPGEFICIVPVQNLQRGRLFLPFVDSDPRTAEVVSKVLLLARDQEIRDPTLLEQLLPRG